MSDILKNVCPSLKSMITSTTNNRIKNIIRLCSSSKARREQDVFVAEGIKMFIEAPLARIREVFISEELYEKITSVNSSPTDKPDSKGDVDNTILTKCRDKIDETGYDFLYRFS